MASRFPSPRATSLGPNPDALVCRHGLRTPAVITTSGYPRIAKRWQRGTPLAAGQDDRARRTPSDVSRGRARDGRWRHTALAVGGRAAIDFYHEQREPYRARRADWCASPLPDRCRRSRTCSTVGVVALLRSDWKGPQGRYRSSPIRSRISSPAKRSAIETVFAPTAQSGGRGGRDGEPLAASGSSISTMSRAGLRHSVARGRDGRWHITADSIARQGHRSICLERRHPPRTSPSRTVQGMLMPPTLYAGAASADVHRRRSRRLPTNSSMRRT